MKQLKQNSEALQYVCNETAGVFALLKRTAGIIRVNGTER